MQLQMTSGVTVILDRVLTAHVVRGASNGKNKNWNADEFGPGAHGNVVVGLAHHALPTKHCARVL